MLHLRTIFTLSLFSSAKFFVLRRGKWVSYVFYNCYVSNAKLVKKQIGCYLLGIFLYKEFTDHFGYKLFLISKPHVCWLVNVLTRQLVISLLQKGRQNAGNVLKNGLKKKCARLNNSSLLPPDYLLFSLKTRNEQREFVKYKDVM